MFVEALYVYHLLDVDGVEYSVTSTGSTSEILSEYQGYVLVSREIIGYRAILAD